MKIAILGYSGAGKSTLARALAQKYHVDVLHFDTVQFLPNWAIRDKEEKAQMTEAFMNTHDGWVIDGNYSKLSFARRMEEADVIVLMLFNRFSCFGRAYNRYRRYKEQTRPDMAVGCNEKFDWDFAKWILYKGRTRETRARFRSVIAHYPNKVVVLKNQRALDRYMQKEQLV